MNLKKSSIPLQVISNCVVASIQIDLNKSVLNLFKNELLVFCSQVNLKGIILDLSGQRIIDNEDFENLRKIIDSAKMMGYPTVLCGFRPGVVASLVLMDVNLKGIIATRDMDDAFLRLGESDKRIESEDEINQEESEINIEEDGKYYDYN